MEEPTTKKRTYPKAIRITISEQMRAEVTTVYNNAGIYVSDVVQTAIAKYGDSLPDINEEQPCHESLLIRLPDDIIKQIDRISVKNGFKKTKTLRILIGLSLKDNTAKLAALNLQAATEEPVQFVTNRIDDSLYEALLSFRAFGISSSHLARLAIKAHKGNDIPDEWLRNQPRTSKFIQLGLTEADRDRLKSLAGKTLNSPPPAKVLRALIRNYIVETKDAYAQLFEQKRQQ